MNNFYKSNENISIIELDITNKNSINEFLNKIENIEIYSLINCAGGGGGPMYTNILQEEQEYLNNAFNLNTSSTFNLIKQVYPKMKNDPIIINITSISAYQIFKSSSAYTISKHSESIMSKILRRDLAEVGIRLAEIVPSTVNSYKDENNKISLNPEDIAELVNFMLNAPTHVNFNTVYINHTKEVPFLS